MNCYFTTGCGLLPTNKVNFSDTLMHLKSITAVFSNKNQSSTRNHPFCMHVPYSRKYWWSIKFGSLAVGEATVKCKSVKFKCDLHIILRVRVRAYYIYGTTAKFKSANIFISAARDQTAKFKDRQYFQLYGMSACRCTVASCENYSLYGNAVALFYTVYVTFL